MMTSAFMMTGAGRSWLKARRLPRLKGVAHQTKVCIKMEILMEEPCSIVIMHVRVKCI